MPLTNEEHRTHRARIKNGTKALLALFTKVGKKNKEVLNLSLEEMGEEDQDLVDDILYLKNLEAFK